MKEWVLVDKTKLKHLEDMSSLHIGVTNNEEIVPDSDGVKDSSVVDIVEGVSVDIHPQISNQNPPSLEVSSSPMVQVSPSAPITVEVLPSALPSDISSDTVDTKKRKNTASDVPLAPSKKNKKDKIEKKKAASIKYPREKNPGSTLFDNWLRL